MLQLPERSALSECLRSCQNRLVGLVGTLDPPADSKFFDRPGLQSTCSDIHTVLDDLIDSLSEGVAFFRERRDVKEPGPQSSNCSLIRNVEEQAKSPAFPLDRPTATLADLPAQSLRQAAVKTEPNHHDESSDDDERQSIISRVNSTAAAAATAEVAAATTAVAPFSKMLLRQRAKEDFKDLLQRLKPFKEVACMASL